MGTELLIFVFGRFIICTSAKSVKGENQRTKLSLKQKENNNLTIRQLNRTQIFLNSLGVGALLFAGVVFHPFEIARAHAADSFNPNIETARQAISTVAPIETLHPHRSSDVPLPPAPDGFLSKPLIAETKVTRTSSVNNLQTRSLTTKSVPLRVKLATDGRNHFAYGYCTFYVASRRNIPWFGNAGTWLSGARAAGFATGNVPQVGAIIVTSESRVGHVGLVEAVNGDGTITISEMNYSGFARITSRTISVSYSVIKGYIY